MSKKKKIALPPRRKRMKREGRLQHVKVTGWIGIYDGNHIVRGYSRWFGVDLQCAMYELELLGYQITEKDKLRVYHSIESKQIERRKRKEKREQQMLEEEMLFEEDDDLPF